MFGTFSGFPSGLFDEFNQLRREMDQVFNSWGTPTSIRAVTRGSFPAVNIGVSPEAVDVYVMVPGVDSDSLDVSIQQNLLTISGDRTVEPPQDENTNVHLQERFSGTFKRTINLPDDVDPERVEANSQDGVLRVTVHRREEAKPRQIEIK